MVDFSIVKMAAGLQTTKVRGRVEERYTGARIRPRRIERSDVIGCGIASNWVGDDGYPIYPSDGSNAQSGHQGPNVKYD